MVRLVRLAGLAAALALPSVVLAAPGQEGTLDGQAIEGVAADREWRFRVLLDGRDIGYHSFRVFDEEAGERVEIDARFDVRFLFFNAYSYRHENTERWSDGCLEEIRSQTRDGRDRFSVAGTTRGDRFVVETVAGQQAIPSGCVSSFAYWNPGFLAATRLLNAQTGEWMEASVVDEGEESLEISGASIPARRYRLRLPEGDISLWYGHDGQWLALQAPAPGGRTLRYEPEQLPGDRRLAAR